MSAVTTDLAIDLRQMLIAIETAVSLVGMNDVAVKGHGETAEALRRALS